MKEIFSPYEKKVLTILGRKKLKINEITQEFFGRKRPVNANNTVASTIRRIATKCEYHELPWTLEGEGAGRAGKTVWRTKRAN